MAQTAARLLDSGIPHVSVQPWVLSLPIPLLAAQPELVTLVLQVVHGVITRVLLEQAGPKTDKAQGAAVMLIQRFGSAAYRQPEHPSALPGPGRRLHTRHGR